MQKRGAFDHAVGHAWIGMDAFHPCRTLPAVRETGFDHSELSRCGFYCPLELTGFEPGPHRLSLKAIPSGNDSFEALHVDVILEKGSLREGRSTGKAAGHIDPPLEVHSAPGTLLIHGWALYGPDTDHFLLTCAGTALGRFYHDIPRPDVRAKLGDAAPSDRIGFAVPVESRDLPPGERVFRLEAVRRDGTTEDLHALPWKVEEVPEGAREPSALSSSASSSPRCTRDAFDDPTEMIYADPTRKTDFSPFCTLPWTTTYLAFDGILRPCCFSEHDMSLGNLKEESFEEIWNGKKYGELRRMILTGRIPEGCKGCMANARIHGRAIFDKFKHFL